MHNNDESKSLLWVFRGLAVFGILLAVIGSVGIIWFTVGNGFDYISTNPSDRIGSTDFSIMASMPPALISDLIHPAWITIVAMALGFGIALRLEMRQRRIQALISLAIVMGIVFCMTHWSLYICEDMISSKKFGIAVAEESQPEDRLVVVGDYETANSLNFYQKLQVEVVDGMAYTLPDDQRIVLTKEEYLEAWRSPERVYVLTLEEKIPQYAPNGTVVKKALHRVLLRNQ